jgi:uncharacterized protein (TIGR03435 family)
MLQTLLAERFKLTLHREKRDHAIYALVAGKNGPKLKPAEDSGPLPADAPPPRNTAGPPPSGGGAFSQGPGPTLSKGPAGAPPKGAMMMQMSPDGVHFKAPAATLSQLAESLSRFSERPVVDMTGITGKYDFDLLFSPETMRGMRPGGLSGPPPSSEAHPEGQDSAAGSIYDAVQQYGLKLEARKAPMEMLIIDHLEKSPTEN